MLRDYVRMCRPDHWFKNAFLLPGTALALALSDAPVATWLPELLVALVSVCLAASANYLLNEYVDAEFDAQHPLKKDRPCVTTEVSAGRVGLLYALLVVASCSLAAVVGSTYLVITGAFLFMGLLYNLRPARTKERMYVDVLSESLNNPLRLLLGWSVVIDHSMPPSSVLIAYWMAGAFLMGIKRFAELRTIGDPRVAAAYRRSLGRYTEESLLVSSVFYSLCSVFFFGIFLLKHRIEYLLSFPFIALLFSWYLAIGLEKDSEAQRPERLYRRPLFLAYVLFLVALLTALTFVDRPWLGWLLEVQAY